MVKDCIVCGKEFTAQRATKKYCSRSCENRYRTIRKKEIEAAAV